MIEIQLPALHPGQQKVVNEAKRYNVLACGRRWGKDTLLDALMLPAFLSGKTVAVLLPKDVDRDKVIERLKVKYLGQLLSEKLISYDSRIYAFKSPDGGEIRFYTTRNVNSIRGSSLDMFICNEAGEISLMADLDKAIWQQIVRPTLIDHKGVAWFAGTPRGITGFYNLYARGQEGTRGWASWNFSTYDNPLLDEEEIDAMIQQEKLSKVAIEQEIYARFIQAEGHVFVEIDKACVLKPVEPNGYPPRSCVIGVDVGGTTDYTAVSVMSARKTPANELHLYRWRTPQVRITQERLLEICLQWMPVEVLIETNAIGDYYYQELAYKLANRGIVVKPHYTSSETKADAIHSLRHALENRALFLLDDEHGQAELAAFNMSLTATGRYRFGGASGVHDDTVMARAIAYSAVRRYTTFSPIAPIRMKTVPLDAPKRTTRATYALQDAFDPLRNASEYRIESSQINDWLRDKMTDWRFR